MGLYSGTINVTTVFIGKMNAFMIEVATIGPVVKRVLIDGEEWYISIGSSLICFYTHILVSNIIRNIIKTHMKNLIPNQ